MSRRFRYAALGPLVVVAVAGAVTVVVAGHHDRSGPTAVWSTGGRVDDLATLVDRSRVVVIGRAEAVAGGRTVATGTASLRSSIVRVRVGAVLAGVAPGPVIAVEEEATLADGTPIVVDGLRPTRVGDEGVWFLVAGDGTALVTASTQGRLLRRTGEEGDDRLLAIAGDRLSADMVAMGGRRLADAVVARARATGRPLGPIPHP